jgi:hypothetical protein
MQAFNNQSFKSLKDNSRFKEVVERSKTELSTEKFYDIKGNTFKETLVPKQTAFSALKLKQFNQTVLGDKKQKMAKVQPKYGGYRRSGMILFENINQTNTIDFNSQVAPRRCSSNLN